MPVRLGTVAISVRELNLGAELPYVGLEHVETATGGLVPGFKSKTKSVEAEVVFQISDVLFGKLRPYLAKALAPDFSGCASGEFLVLRPGPQLRPRFLFYTCLSRPFLQWAEASSVGTKMPRTDWEAVSAFRFELPTPEHQGRVITFLDRETTHLDELIVRRRSLMKLLSSRWESELYRAVTKGLNPQARLRMSELSWGGDIPYHWGTPPVYANFDVQLGKMLNPERAAGPTPAPYLRNVNVQWDRIDLTDLGTMSFGEADRVKYALAPGDLLVCEGGEVGRAAIWRGDLAECYYQKAVHRLRPRGDVNARFLMYCLWTAASMNVFIVEGNQATIVHLTAEQLRAHRFPMPPRPEQDSIVAHLDRRREHLRTLTLTIERQIDLLRERRQALITAAVTGQLDVSGEAA
jgi:type I restriction enzyme S subunit